MEQIQNILSFLSSNAHAITIILVFVATYFIKPVRRFIGKKIRDIVGINDINKKFGELNEKVDKVIETNEEQKETINQLKATMEKHQKDDEIKRNIQKIQIKFQLQQTLEKYIKGNYATIDEKKNVQELYQAWQQINKNVTSNGELIDVMWESFVNLPDKRDS